MYQSTYGNQDLKSTCFISTTFWLP